MDMTYITHVNLNQRYKVTFERAASTKRTMGFKVEANGDVLADTMNDAHQLKDNAELIAGGPQIEGVK